MNIKSVSNRFNCLHSKPLNDSYKLDIYIEQFTDPKSTESLEKIVENWNKFGVDKLYSFKEACNYIKEYIKTNNPSSKELNSVVNIINTKALPYIENCNSLKKELTGIFKKYPDICNTFIDTLEDLAISDRIINNESKLNKIGFNDIFKDDSINIENTIEEACEKINTLKINESVKYNICLENILYELNNHHIKYDLQSLFEEVTDFFFLKSIDDNDISKLQNVFTESPLYNDVNKSNVIYALEMSRKNLPDNDFGVPEQRKFPMPDKKHVLSAIRFFNYVDPEHEKELASKIKSKIKQYGISDIHVGDSNRFKKYYSESNIIEVNEIVKCPYCDETADLKTIKSHIKNRHPKEAKRYPHYTESYLKNLSENYNHDSDDTVVPTTDNDNENTDKETEPISPSNYISSSNDDDKNKKENNSAPESKDDSNDSDVEDESSVFDIGINMNNIYENALSEATKININKAKEILTAFKSTPKKSKEAFQKMIKSFFVQSPESIVEELPDLLSFLRKFLCISLVIVPPGFLGITLAAISYGTNKLIEMHLRKPVLDKAIKSYKKEIDKIENKLYTVKDEKKTKALKEMKRKLEDDLYRLETANDKLYSQKEIDKRYEAEFESTSKIFPHPIGITDFNNNHKYDFIKELYRTVNLFQTYIEDNSKYKSYMDRGIIKMVDPKELHKFETSDATQLFKYIEYNKVEINIAYFLPLLAVNSTQLSIDQSLAFRNDIIDICDKINDIIPNDYTFYMDGTDDIYYFKFEYTMPIYNPNYEQERYYVIDQIKALDDIDEAFTNIFDGKKIKLVSETFNDAISNDTVDYILPILKESMGILDEDSIKKGLSRYNESHHEHDYESMNTRDKINRFLENADNFIPKYEYRNTILTGDKFKNINESFDSILELSVGSNSRLAVNKVKTTGKRLLDKERNISNRLDNSLEKIDADLRKNVSDANREKIIKGRVLPKASKIIKMGIGTGVLYAIQPALAAIAVLGSIGASKLGSKKEKQFILDEIDIQLKLVDKKIQLAENNNDMKALEELFKIEKKLKREKQRIFYNMKARYPVSASE